MKKEVCAVIVSYNPEENIYQNVKKIKNLIDFVVIVDNGSSSDQSKHLLKKIERDIENCTIIYNEKNLGIATALNQGCEYAERNGFQWALTLDDDSSVPENMIENLLKAYNDKKDEKIMILAPVITDYNGKGKNRGSGYIDAAITSGSLINTKSFSLVGWFKDEYFIDMVDIEYCFRLKKNGYKVYQVEDAILRHRLGREKHILKIGKKEWKALNHNEIRKYYIYRNTVQLYKEYLFKYPIRVFLSTKGVFKIMLDTIVIEEDKFKKIKMMGKGFIDGLRNNMGSLNNKEISR
ncbi:glycosyltransferase family 2 protein [Bacillus sp. 22475]|uniref:Glycosyltransferase 2-like domain-containing protein n=1 Tax=Bacillus cereus TaxID=1396 RepID=A0A9X6GCX9_BACCE|nr:MULTISPECIES: glycosyltransferase family 2 protein [Bacillus]CGG06704.1 EpsQ protein [Streptococcus pneumoniae]ASI75436.1 hypothetical protein BA203_25570 [Bacillus cereus]MBR9688304.1 glycosyltransferase family 2 protein [Bacillus cereus]MEB9967514.1 glycosyltransferase family 2 protein [Bacillus cereus]OLR83168.1 hypothetical protein BTO25_05290 [Bacillus sp. MB366]